jgi:hypothetical protein
MGGTIGVESEGKIGSEFYVVFPTCQSSNRHEFVEFNQSLADLP